MKTLSATLILCTTAIILAILAPGATSSTNDEAQIKSLQDSVASLEGDLSDLETMTSELQNFRACYEMAAAVTSYTGRDGKPYLAATRQVGQKFIWVSVVKPGCMPRVKPAMLGWKY